MKSFFILISSLIFINMGFTQPLSDHRWQERVILLFASDDESLQLCEQLELLTSQMAEVTSRDLLIYQVFKDDGRGPGQTAIDRQKVNALRRHYQVEADVPFQFILIGKDGGVKMRSSAIVSMQSLFARIDAMPMRQVEMKRQKEEKSYQKSQH
jgi:hypothetical protein